MDHSHSYWRYESDFNEDKVYNLAVEAGRTPPSGKERRRASLNFIHNYANTTPTCLEDDLIDKLIQYSMTLELKSTDMPTRSPIDSDMSLIHHHLHTEPMSSPRLVDHAAGHRFATSGGVYSKLSINEPGYTTAEKGKSKLPSLHEKKENSAHVRSVASTERDNANRRDYNQQTEQRFARHTSRSNFQAKKRPSLRVHISPYYVFRGKREMCPCGSVDHSGSSREREASEVWG